MATALETSLLDLHPRELQGMMIDIPTLPEVYRELFRRLQDEEVTVPAVAEIIARDQALTARILHLVNSAFYGCQQQITTIKRAVVVLGLRAVRNTALTTSVFDYFGAEADGETVDLARFWEHSVAVAAICRTLAASRLPQHQDEAWVAGLLHDVGKLVEKRHFPEDFDHIRQVAAEQGLPWYDCEGRLFAVNHAQIGKAVLRNWNFPAAVVEAVHLHHSPEAARRNPQLSALVHVADVLAYGMGYGAPGSPPPLACSRPALDLLALESADGPGDEPRIRDEIARGLEILTLAH
jgi:putative nucleotidyltransferase with HDIG domain